MKTRIKYLFIMGAITLTQSCNMSKHYGNMRIDHDGEEITTTKKSPATHSKKPAVIELVAACNQHDSTIVAHVGKSDTSTKALPKQHKTKQIFIPKKPVLVNLAPHSPIAKKNKAQTRKNSRKKKKLRENSANKSMDSSDVEDLLSYGAIAGLLCWFAADVAATEGLTYVGALLVVTGVSALLILLFCLFLAFIFRDVDWGKVFFWTWQ